MGRARDSHDWQQGADNSMRYAANQSFETDLAACRKLLSTGSRTFYAASFLLPKRIRDPATALYAFCRLADDVIDLGASARDGLAELEDRLDRAYAGRPLDIAADRAFAVTVDRYDIPRAIPSALLEGFAWDATGEQYETLGDLHAYAARVAGTVGAMMALLMNRRSPEDVARATDLGIAMQLTNIARDVGEDARVGRLYLPRQWLREADVDPDAWLANPKFNAKIALVVDRLLTAAEDLYARANLGIARLPADCRPGIYAARYLYAGIGHEVMRQGCDSVSQRAVVPISRKLKLLGYAIAATPVRRPVTRALAVAEAAFLVAAATGTPPARLTQATLIPDAPWWDIHAKAVVFVDLLHRLEQRELASREARIRDRQRTSPQFGAEAQT